MDEELNGRMDLRSFGPNEQNSLWAERLAEDSLGRPQDTGKGQRLPIDMIVIVAEFIAGSRDLMTLASLNVASRDIHEGSLPVLYETLVFADEKAFERSVSFTNAKGWKYVKFLFVTEITLPILRIHLRYQSERRAMPTDDLSASFPRLILLGLTDLTTSPVPRNHDRPLHLTLYKPIRFASLLLACLPYGLDEAGCGITFFGTSYFRRNTTKDSIRSPCHRFRDIVQLDVRPGAYIARENGWTLAGMDGWHVVFCGEAFRLSILGDIDEVGVEDTLRTVVKHLALHASSERFIASGKEVKFEIKCSQSVFERFIELYETQQPCFLNLQATLTTPLEKCTIKHYLTTMCAIYRQHWRHHTQTRVYIFLSIRAPGGTIPRNWTALSEDVNDPEAQNSRMTWQAEAQFGMIGMADGQQRDNDPEDDEMRLDDTGIAAPPRAPVEAPADNEEGVAPPTDHPGAGLIAVLFRLSQVAGESQSVFLRAYRAPPPPTVSRILRSTATARQGSLSSMMDDERRQAEILRLAAIFQHLRDERESRENPLLRQPSPLTPQEVEEIAEQVEQLRRDRDAAMQISQWV
ncbi:hypothetical protein QFC22_004744 [Naganishia vaughanmartiniae]|uniref:Uncharacterized protein n=1 Tax=Naganishia vaughanmartiniae TaxID=1424756 RepID=A0ACC2WX62_9TREE|nr:hypothetical protein QFC22_004744 [Naganishia vaughanmartiniae]